jgi:DNA modification methylase
MNVKTLEDIENVGQVSANTIIKGDCLEAMKYIADKSIDMVLYQNQINIIQRI